VAAATAGEWKAAAATGAAARAAAATFLKVSLNYFHPVHFTADEKKNCHAAAQRRAEPRGAQS
jgi:hypothetical protein